MIWPDDIPIQKVKISSNSPSFRSEAQNLKSYTALIPAHRWEITITTIPLYIPEHRAFHAWINSLNGRAGVFDIVLPIYSDSHGVATGNPVTNSGLAGDSVLYVSGCPRNVINWLRAGDYIRFANHSKVYQVAQDVTTDAQGDGAIILANVLQSDVTGGVSVAINNVPFTLALRNEIQEYEASRGKGKFVTFELDCIEDL